MCYLRTTTLLVKKVCQQDGYLLQNPSLFIMLQDFLQHVGEIALKKIDYIMYF